MAAESSEPNNADNSAAGDDLKKEANFNQNSFPAAFLFGNVDEDGNLENDELMDDDTRKALANVAGSLITETAKETFMDGQDDEERAHSKQASEAESAEDFDAESSDENTMLEQEVNKVNGNILDNMEGADEDKKFFDCLAAHLVNQLVIKTSAYLERERINDLNAEFSRMIWDKERAKKSDLKFDRTKIDKPLNHLMPEFYRDFNITDIFPFFTDEHSLRFFKLFKSIYYQEYSPKYYNFTDKKSPTVLRYYLNQNEKSEMSKSNFVNQSEFDVDQKRKTEIFGRRNNEAKDLSNWVEGPAGMWYKNQNFGLSGFSISQCEYTKPESEPKFKTKIEESFVDKIIFDAELEPEKIYLPKVELDRRIKLAGWIPSTNCKSYADFCRLNNMECFISKEIYKNIEQYNKPIHDEVNILASKPFNMFNQEIPQNHNLIKWDEKIMLNIDRKDKTMHIPLSFCTIDPLNKTMKFKNVYRAVIDKVKINSETDLNHFIGELGQKQISSEPKPFKETISQPEIIEKQKSSSGLMHSVPVEQLHPLLFPTFLSVSKLRTYQRHPLRRYSHGQQADFENYHPISLLNPKVELQRDKTDIVMRDFDDLSAEKDCIVLFEYMEQYPPFLNQVGMASMLINYKRVKNATKQMPTKNWKPEDQAEFDATVRRALQAPVIDTNDEMQANGQFVFGTKTVEVQNIAFPGQPEYNKVVQSFENNMFRTLAHGHEPRPNDFLFLRNRNYTKLREINGLYSLGQEIPLVEVLTPCSKQSVAFNRDFFKIYVYRLFRIASEDGYRVKMDDIRKAFPNTSENTLRKRLKHCADFRRFGCAANKGGNLVNYWILRDDFIIPDETVITKMVSPEDCCSFYSMRAASQRLRDNGYVNKLVSLDDEESLVDESGGRMEDELLSAPWNTTKTYLECLRGRAIYQVYGNADPTSKGAGFAFVKRVLRPPRDDTYLLNAVRTIRTADNDRKIEASIKRLSIGEARRLLSLYKFVSADEINSLNKWSLIEKIIDTFKANRSYPLEFAPETIELLPENDMHSLAARKESYSNMQNRFKHDCQKVFDVQLKLISNPKMFEERIENSVANKDQTNDDQMFEALGKDIEQMLQNDDEEESNQNRNAEDGQTLMTNTNQSHADSSIANFMQGKKLHIVRKFRDDEGKIYNRIDVVKDPSIIEGYVRARQSHQTMPMNDWELSGKGFREWQHKKTEVKRRQRRKPLNAAPPRKRPKTDKVLKLKCGACGQVGHMKSNKDCPYYQRTQAKMLSKKIMPGQQAQVIPVPNPNAASAPSVDKKVEENNVMIKFFENQVVLTNKFYKKPNQVQNSLQNDDGFEFESFFKFPEDTTEAQLAMMQELEAAERANLTDLSTQPAQITTTVKRESVQSNKNQLSVAKQHHAKKSETSENAALPSPKNEESEASDMHDEGSNPIQLDFSSSLNTQVPIRDMPALQAENSALQYENWVRAEMQKYSSLYKFVALGSPVNSFNYFLSTAVKKISKYEFSQPFLLPVNEVYAPKYYKIISSPMSINIISEKIETAKYASLQQFMQDITQLVTNSEIYNGFDNEYTVAARKVNEAFKTFFSENAINLCFLDTLNNSQMPENALMILTASLSNIVDSLSGTECGTRLINFETLKPNLFDVFVKVILHSYTNIASFKSDLSRIYDFALNSPNYFKELDAKAFGATISAMLSSRSFQLENLFNTASPLLLARENSTGNPIKPPHVNPQQAIFSSDSTSLFSE